jgi:hypothetical protein
MKSTRDITRDSRNRFINSTGYLPRKYSLLGSLPSKLPDEYFYPLLIPHSSYRYYQFNHCNITRRTGQFTVIFTLKYYLFILTPSHIRIFSPSFPQTPSINVWTWNIGVKMLCKTKLGDSRFLLENRCILFCCLVLISPMYFANLKDKCENNGPQTVYWLSETGTCKINWHCSPFVTRAAV